MAESDFDLQPFKALVRERCGLACESGGEEKLRTALLARMPPATPLQYLARLKNEADEFQELVNRLTINETYFFREAEQIELLVTQLLPALYAARPSKIRILSAGCSSGEEPYSLALAILDKLGEEALRRTTIIGIDIDSAILEKARAARYGDFAFRGTTPAFRQRHFLREAGEPPSYRLKEEIRQQVQFQQANLLADTFPPALHNFDVVFLRNVSIYFDTDTRRQMQHNISQLLTNEGVLLVGTAETLANDLGVLNLVESGGLFYFTRRPAVAPLPATAPQPAPCPPVHKSPPACPPLPVPAIRPPPAPPAALPEWPQIRQWLQETRYDEARPALAAVLAANPEDTPARLLQAYLLLEGRDFAGTQNLAAKVLETRPWSVDALLLLGLAAKWCGETAKAIDYFKRAIYTRHQCWPAYHYLADLHRERGDSAQLARCCRVVIELSARPDCDSSQHTGIEYVPFALPLAAIRFLCQHRLARSGVPPESA